MSQNRREFEQLKKKVDQHEETITQLIEIIAATNRQLYELTNQKKHNKPIPLIYHSFPK